MNDTKKRNILNTSLLQSGLRIVDYADEDEAELWKNDTYLGSHRRWTDARIERAVAARMTFEADDK
jgi:uncharacterized membrane protein